MFSVPQKYYVLRRIHDTYIPRLKAVGLWNLPVEKRSEKNRSRVSRRACLLEVSSRARRFLIVLKRFNPKRYIYSFPLYIHFYSECFDRIKRRHEQNSKGLGFRIARPLTLCIRKASSSLIIVIYICLLKVFIFLHTSGK